MINKDIINNKIKNLITYLDEIRPILAIETSFLLKSDNYKDLRALEREFQLIVDTMIEINSHIISKQKFEIPDDYTNTFFTLGRHEVLPFEFANKVAGVVGLRNKIVHKYEIIDQKKFVDDLKENSRQFDEYIGYIKDYLNKIK